MLARSKQHQRWQSSQDCGYVRGSKPALLVSMMYVLVTLCDEFINSLTPIQALLLPGWLASIAFTVCTLMSTERYGSGTHTWDVPFSDFVPLAFLAWLAEVLYLFSTGCTKCSVLFFYRRLTKGSYNKRWKYAIIMAIAITAAYSIGFIIVLITACSPTSAYWRIFNPFYQGKYKCYDTKISNILSGVLSVASDLWSVLLPCIMLYNFDAPRRQKIALNIIFCLGLLVVAAGSARTYYLYQVGHSIDLTWDGYDLLVWAQLETQLSLICASAPALRVFFRDYLSNPVLRALSSARTDSRQNSRRMSKRIHDESSSSSNGTDSMPLTSFTADKPSSLDRLSEEDVEAATRRYGAHGKRMAPTEEELDYAVRDLEVNRPPVAYPLRDRQPAQDHRYGHYTEQ